MITLQDPREIVLDGSTRDLLSQVTRGIEELNTLRPFSPDVETRIRTTLLPDRIVASLNMEGIVATRRQTLDVMDAMRVNESVGRGQLEIYNALKADEFICDCVDRGVTLSSQVLRELNAKLLDGVRSDAGKPRAGEVDLPGAPFRPPAPGDVPPLMDKLCELVPLSASLHPIVQAAWLHEQFTLIHPFSDGNGRGGRLLQDFALIRRGLLPVGIPTANRDDYYTALASADQGKWDSFVELLSVLELSMITRTLVIAKEPEKRAAWIQKLSKAASAKRENTLHKQYLVWRERMERVSKAFVQAANELDEAADNIGAEVREFSVVDFSTWKRICDMGYTEGNWLFSVVFFAERKPFYKSIAFLERHRPQTAVDTFVPERDLVGLYFTGIPAHSFDRPVYQNYRDPHIRLREILFRGQDSFQYVQENPEEQWRCVPFTSVEDVVERFFMDVFMRKAGLGA
jgi:fido (protein-threonine AMPylation protein)